MEKIYKKLSVDIKGTRFYQEKSYTLYQMMLLMTD